mmetsp:Transcript_46667/g.148088  ORF Transcript_46667/g.148088 Transcript_46667/m.148088 type:complete len:247 (-) Transcript_46667:283-1023(-)
MRGKEQRWSHCRPALDLRIPPHEVVRFAQHPPEVGRAHAHRAEEAVRLLHKLAVERAHQREAGEEGVPPLLHRLERVEEGELAEWIVSAVALAQLDQRRVVAAELLVLRPHHLALKGRLLPAEGRRRHRLRARQLRHHIRLPRRRLLGGEPVEVHSRRRRARHPARRKGLHVVRLPPHHRAHRLQRLALPLGPRRRHLEVLAALEVVGEPHARQHPLPLLLRLVQVLRHLPHLLRVGRAAHAHLEL